MESRHENYRMQKTEYSKPGTEEKIIAKYRKESHGKQSQNKGKLNAELSSENNLEMEK